MIHSHWTVITDFERGNFTEETLEKIKSKWPRMLTKGMLLHQENAPAHKCVLQWLSNHQIKEGDQPVQSTNTTAIATTDCVL